MRSINAEYLNFDISDGKVRYSETDKYEIEKSYLKFMRVESKKANKGIQATNNEGFGNLQETLKMEREL